MFVLFDKLTATLVTASVLLVLVSLQKNMAQSNVQQAISYNTKAHALNFGRWLQADLMQAGTNIEGGPSQYLGSVDSTDGIGVKLRFEYESGGVLQNVIYTLSMTGDSLSVNDSTRVPLYQLDRRRGPAGSEVAEGSSMPTLTAFQVVYLDENGDPTLSNAAARSIRVRFSSGVPVEIEGQYMREAHWATTVPLL